MSAEFFFDTTTTTSSIIYYIIVTPLFVYLLTRILTKLSPSPSPSPSQSPSSSSTQLLSTTPSSTTSSPLLEFEQILHLKDKIKDLRNKLEETKKFITSTTPSPPSEEEEEEMSFLTSKRKTSTTSTAPVSGTGSGLSAPSSPGFAPRACNFKKFGCSTYFHSKMEMENHLRDEAQFHLQLVVEKFDQQFDLHTQLMAHFTEQMEDQLDRTMKVVKNHMDSFGTTMQGKIDEGVDKCMNFAKKVEQQQQQLAKRLITQKVATASPISKGLSSEDLDGAAPHNTLVNAKQLETELHQLRDRLKKETTEFAEEMASKLEKKTNLRIDLVESDLQSKVDRKALNVAIDDSWSKKQELIESNIAKKLEEKDKKRNDQFLLSMESKFDGLREKIKTVEVNCVDISSDVRKLKLEGNGSSGTGSYRSSVSLPVAPTFNKNEVLDEIKKVEQQLNDKLSKSEKKSLEEINQTRSDLSDLQRKVKSTQGDILDTKTQADKQAGKIKQIEDDLRKSDSLLLLVQNNLKKHTEFIDKEKERETERQRILDSIKLLEENQKKIAADIAEGNEQVERVLREEAAGNGANSISNSSNSVSNSVSNGREVSSQSPISSPPVTSPSSVPRSPLLSKRGSSAFSSSPQITSRSPSSDLSNDDGENGILWEYDPIIDKWIRLSIKLKVERKPFAEGALRQAYHTVSLGVSSDVNYPLGNKHSFPSIESISPISVRNEASNQLKSGTKFVLKLYKKEAEQQASRELYFEDVKMQMVCRDWGHRFNQKKPPKKIEFLMSWVVELVDRGNNPVLCSIEPLLVGEFKKNNSNYGAVLTNRSTPQAFSHFTYENSNKQMIIIDIQGVDDLYTDPQVHTADGKGFGLGNLGKTGINKFITSHKCNAVCALLNLDVKLGGSSLLSKQQLTKGTMIMPDIVGDLHNGGEIQVKVGANELPRADMSRKELKCVNTIQSFRESINAVCFFDNDRYVCAGYGDGVMRVFDLQNNWQIAQTFYCHRKPIVSVCSNSKYIFTSSPDQTIKVHSLKNPNSVIQTLIGHSGEVSCIRANETHLFSCSYDKTIRVWDLNTFRETKTMEQMHTKYIKTLCLSGRYLFSGGNDQTIYVWDTETFTCLFNMSGHDDWVLSLQTAGPYLFSTSKDNQIKIWDLTDFHCIETLKGHWNSVSSSIVNDRFLYSGSEDNSIKVWDLDTLECSYTMQKAHSLGVKSLSFYKNQLISAAFDGSIKIWEWVTK